MTPADADIDGAPPRSTRSNGEGEIVLRVPERDVPLLRKVFEEMALRLAMQGDGDLARAMEPYARRLREARDLPPHFDDGAVARVLIGLSRGFPAVMGADALDAGGFRVSVEFPSAGRSVVVAETATPEATERFRDWFEDAASRLGPPDPPSFD